MERSLASPIAGIFWALAFVVLESVQFVYFGGLFQRVNSFLFGACVLGVTTVLIVAAAAICSPDQLRRAFANPGLLLTINVTATLAWVAFLASVQLIEPAIAYTIGAGVMPITAWFIHRIGWREGEPMRNRAEATGNVVVALAILFLSMITLMGLSGFVRGGALAAVAGIGFVIADGVLFTLLLVFCQRLDRKGVGPATIFGLRFPLYALTAGGVALVTANPEMIPNAPELAWIIVLGLALVIPPLYALQRAVTLISTLTLSALTATGPFVIFAMQIAEGRIAQSGLTLAGLVIYFAGALLGAVRASTSNR